jgi:hypothetical protein
MSNGSPLRVRFKNRFLRGVLGSILLIFGIIMADFIVWFSLIIVSLGLVLLGKAVFK